MIHLLWEITGTSTAHVPRGMEWHLVPLVLLSQRRSRRFESAHLHATKCRLAPATAPPQPPSVTYATSRPNRARHSDRGFVEQPEHAIGLTPCSRPRLSCQQWPHDLQSQCTMSQSATCPSGDIPHEGHARRTGGVKTGFRSSGKSSIPPPDSCCGDLARGPARTPVPRRPSRCSYHTVPTRHDSVWRARPHRLRCGRCGS